MTQDRALGALLGLAVGDALGMPVEGLSHQNVRLYYKGIKEYRADEKRGELAAGQWTADTQRALALAHALAAHPDDAEAAHALFAAGLDRLVLRRDRATPHAPHAVAAVSAVPLGVAWAAQGWDEREAFRWVRTFFADEHAETQAAAYGQAFAVHVVLGSVLEPEDGRLFVEDVAEEVEEAEDLLGGDRRVSARLHALASHLDETPLDLRDRVGGSGPAADEAFPFALAMFARNPALVEGTLLAAVNVGGDANTVGALVGALLGAHVGWAAFPDAWKAGLEESARLEGEAATLLGALDVGGAT